jgi:hypothetical protein
LLLDKSGSARDWRLMNFSERNQSIKLTPAFNAVVQTYTNLFSEMEHTVLDSIVREARS